jgi:hypothetical protein
MQGNDDMTLDSAQDFASRPRSTAAGLEAWMSGMHTQPTDEATGSRSEDVPAQEASTGPVAKPAAPQSVGPVNAAEALALGMAISARKLTGPDGAELVIDPERSAYYFESTSLKPMLAILEQSAKQWEPVFPEGLAAARSNHSAQPLERLLWFAGLVATPGILGRELDYTERYKLAGWPKTEREYPKHFRIAKAMLQEPATADEIAAASGMPYEDVIDYMNASHAAGRLEATSATRAREASEAAAPSRGSRLMARLNKPLFAR